MAEPTNETHVAFTIRDSGGNVLSYVIIPKSYSINDAQQFWVVDSSLIGVDYWRGFSQETNYTRGEQKLYIEMVRTDLRATSDIISRHEIRFSSTPITSLTRERTDLWRPNPESTAGLKGFSCVWEERSDSPYDKDFFISNLVSAGGYTIYIEQEGTRTVLEDGYVTLELLPVPKELPSGSYFFIN
jgi:hypothetical protein